MSYYTFLMKKIGCKWLNVIPIIILSVFIIVMYIGHLNSNEYQMHSDYTDETQIESLRQEIDLSKKELQSFQIGSDTYLRLQNDIEKMETEVSFLQAKCDAYRHGNWKAYYENDLKLMEMQMDVINTSSESDVYDETYRNAIETDIKYARFMATHGLAFDDRWKPIQGISFMTYTMNEYLPVILTAMTIFISSILYCFCYVDKMNLHHLIPIRQMKQQFTKLIVGVSCGMLVFLFFVFFSIGCASTNYPIGSLQTPVLTYTLEGIKDYLPLIQLLPQVLLLCILSIFFFVNFVSVVSMLTKKRMLCLAISLAIIVTMMWMTTNIVPLAPFTHLLPTTYISSLKVITGEMMQATHNVHVNFTNGFIVLTLSNLVLYGCYFLGNRLSLAKGN